MTHLKLAVLISGRGSNLSALINACKDPEYPAQIAVVISNNPDAPGLEHARNAGLETNVIDHRQFSSKSQFETAISDNLKQNHIDLICLAGFMRLLSANFVAHWENKILNIHPSLLPSFKGLDPHQQALTAGVCVSGCSVHFVTAEMDGGPILSQACVPVLPDDTAEILAKRVLGAEHILYPQTIAWIAKGYLCHHAEKPKLILPAPIMSPVINYPS